jgi:hypothetical protein
MATLWIDENNAYDHEVGRVGFLVSVKPQGRAERLDLRDRPAHTNQSHEPRLTGWCGETNNVNVHAQGLAEVVRVAKNGRILLRTTEDPDAITAALEELGYPELDPTGRAEAK